MVVEPIAPPSFHYVLLTDLIHAQGRCRLRVDTTYYDDERIKDFVHALAVPCENPYPMTAKAMYRQ